MFKICNTKRFSINNKKCSSIKSDYFEIIQLPVGSTIKLLRRNRQSQWPYINTSYRAANDRVSGHIPKLLPELQTTESMAIPVHQYFFQNCKRQSMAIHQNFFQSTAHRAAPCKEPLHLKL